MRSNFAPNFFVITILFSNTESLLVWGAMASAVGKLNSLAENETFPSLPMESPALSQMPLEPYFDLVSPGNVTALVGKSAYLTCRVRNLGDKTVSWIRHRDIHILTVGSYTYTSDQRFQSNHHPETDDWVLQIKWAQKRDAGMYECQISTQPVLSYFVNLKVVVPTAQILGGSDIHVDKGSTINLTCSIRFSPEPPAYIFWYHHDEVISYDSSRGGVSVITEKGDVTTSFLIIQHADISDSGKYSCSPSNADVASVRVHVLNGSLSLAKLGNQTKNSQGSPASSPTMVFSEEYKKEESDLQENDFIKSLCDKIQGEKPSECYKNGNTGNGQFFIHAALLPMITMFTSYLC